MRGAYAFGSYISNRAKQFNKRKSTVRSTNVSSPTAAFLAYFPENRPKTETEQELKLVMGMSASL